jgi:tRNA uridine 5-carbamoylmethylation protein Kti12
MKSATENKYIIMLVGYTHSGKTTFAKKLQKTLKNYVLIDNDEIASFINTKYSPAVFSDYNKEKRTYKEPNLKFLLSKEIFKFCLRASVNIIHASGNLGKDARLLIKNNAQKYNYKLITVYFNLPRDVIMKRLIETKKDTSCFKISINWSQVLEKQESYAELPPSQKDTIYFEIKNQKDYIKTLDTLKKLLLKVK